MTNRVSAAAVRGASLVLRTAAVAALGLLLAPAAPSHAMPRALPSDFASAAPASTGDTQLAAGRKSDSSRPPARGSSAELYGGSSADRYGGSSADRRGVAGKHDPRNKGVRQYTVQNKKRDRDPVEKKKEDEELDDQDSNPPRDMFQFGVPDPSQTRDRKD